MTAPAGKPDRPRATQLWPMPTCLDRVEAVRCQRTCQSAWPTARLREDCLRQPAERFCSVRGLCLRTRLGLSRVFVRIFRHPLANLFLCIRHRRGNHIRSAGPLAKVNRAAAITAEGKLRVGALDHLFADGAAKLESAFTWHDGNISGSGKTEPLHLEQAAGYWIFATRS